MAARILVADALAEAGVEILRSEAQVTVQTGMALERLLETIPSTKPWWCAARPG